MMKTGNPAQRSNLWTILYPNKATERVMREMMTIPAASGISCGPGTARRAEAPTIVLIVAHPSVAIQFNKTGK